MWEHIWSEARFHLGLSDEQFGEYTPLQVHLLLKRQGEQVEYQKKLVGLITAAVVNSGMRAPETPVSPDDFFQRKRVRRRSNMAATRALLMSMSTNVTQ